MQPSPQLVWLREYLTRTLGSSVSPPLDRVLLETPTELPRLRGNPVDRPEGVVPPVWFDCLETAAGQRLAARLGEHSGYTQEYLSWAPSVSYLYDLVVGFARLLAHDDTPDAVRNGLFPTLFTFASILEQQVGLLDVHKVHAKHAGTASEHVYKAIQLDQRARGAVHQYQAGATVDMLARVKKEILSQQIKSTTKAVASRTTGGGAEASSGGRPPQPAAQSGRGASTGGKGPAKQPGPGA